jgi:hypothetical protein
MVRAGEAQRWAALRGWVASAAALSLVLAVALRAWQIHDYISEHLSRRPAVLEGARQIVLVRHDQDLYTQDLVQNDPFLREPVVFLLSRGREADEQMMHRLFPQARRALEDARGEVWRLD